MSSAVQTFSQWSVWVISQQHRIDDGFKKHTLYYYICTVNTCKNVHPLKQFGCVYIFHYIPAYVNLYYTITSSEIVSKGLMIANNTTNEPYWVLLSCQQSFCHTLQLMDISPGNETLQSLITLCNSANKVIFISLSHPLSLLAQSHPGLSNPPRLSGTRHASSSPAPTASRSSAGEKTRLQNHAKTNRARRRMSLRKTNRN